MGNMFHKNNQAVILQTTVCQTLIKQSLLGTMIELSVVND